MSRAAKIVLALASLFLAQPVLAATAPSFSAADVTVSETSPSAIVTVLKSAKASSYSKVNVQTVDGSCHAGTNYTAVNTTLTFSNSGLKQTVAVPLKDNATYNGACAITVKLTAVRFATIARGATITVTDNEPPPPATVWTKCADENGTCYVVGTANVRYGSGSTWTTPRPVTAAVQCNNAVFGDPLFGTVKECDTDGQVGGTPPPAPTPTPTPDPTPHPCYDYSGTTPLGPVPGSNCPARYCPGYANPVDWAQPCPTPAPTSLGYVMRQGLVYKIVGPAIPDPFINIPGVSILPIIYDHDTTGHYVVQPGVVTEIQYVFIGGTPLADPLVTVLP